MFCHVLMRVLLFLWDTTGTLIRVVFPLNLRESLGGKIKRSELDQFEGDLDQIVFACDICGGIDECHCRSPEIYWNDFQSPFDSITMFGKSMPKIFHEAGLDDDDIEIFRRGFNKDFKLDDIIFPDIISPNDGLAKLKDSMKDGYIPPEERK